ncbi:hypothetical protein M141_4435 [Bacteroides fragilis str. S38L5]|uniref:Uncharacterized protein n=1 Tax=Bacteroides fragilis str. 3783N1-6 TaxID=1339310 RepID=A0AB73AGC4_BACFG|nr:hypothetical protein M120_3850 [Bacteroides fragilis str. 3783N1-8]EYA68753.1 hypothetical protein M132_4635 [Bacteroides fragilis str. S24L15]EYA93638.1 hypothetical protein M141_4435 [Bacteroides fragilis str. S38L5]EYB07922.1 hypothetical protein M119_3656 [Bacteroides fragilis str. 3783N1-6]
MNFSFCPVLNFIKNDVSKDERFLKHAFFSLQFDFPEA